MQNNRIISYKGTDKCEEIDEIPESYYILENDTYNNVAECLGGKVRNEDNPKECISKCNLTIQNWYIDKDGKVECTDGLNCNVTGL